MIHGKPRYAAPHEHYWVPQFLIPDPCFCERAEQLAAPQVAGGFLEYTGTGGL